METGPRLTVSSNRLGDQTPGPMGTRQVVYPSIGLLFYYTSEVSKIFIKYFLHIHAFKNQVQFPRTVRRSGKYLFTQV